MGGTGPRGVIASASYEARAFGVSSAQPTAAALRLCPHLRVVPATHGRYGEVSARVFAVFRSVTPLVEGLSLDEAFLDVRGLRNHYESPVAVGEVIRERIRTDPGLPASVGVASTKFVAKLASERAKPDGLCHVPEDEQLEFLHALAAKSLWGVGPATLAGLERLGVETVGDIAELPESALTRALGPTQGHHLHLLARGVDERRVEPDTEVKSISVEETYDDDLESRHVMEAALLAHAQRLASRLHRSGLATRTITLKVRHADFTTLTRSHTLDHAVSGARDLYRVAIGLLAHIDTQRPVRLLGLSGSSLEGEEEPRQLDLDGGAEWSRLDAAIAEVRDKYGDRAVEPARLIEPDD